MKRIRWRLLAAAMVVVAFTAAPAQGSPEAKKDWSTQVDFTKTNLNRYSEADAALLKMTAPERIKDPTERARYQRQLDGLRSAQLAAQRRGATPQKIASIASPLAVATIDPGCQLTSSNPGGYDLCGYNSTGDTMSRFGSGRKHVMWAGVQEKDDPSACGGVRQCWRAWYKSQAFGLTSDNVLHILDVKQFEAWDGFVSGDHNLLGATDPPITPGEGCAPCYNTGTWREQRGPDQGAPSVPAWGQGDFFVRDFVHIQGTSDSSEADNNAASYWWSRNYGTVYCPGPRGWGIGC